MLYPNSHPAQLRGPRKSSSYSGFTLIEVIVTVTIISVLAGAAIPVTKTVLTRAFTKATKVEMQNLSDAAAALFVDTGKLPSNVGDLLIDPGTAGWSGPYLPGSFVDGISGLGGYEVDGWSHEYDLRVSGDVLTFLSQGSDATFGTDDDISLALDVTSIRRAETLDRLQIINNAIAAYNSEHLIDSPLPANYASIRSKLVGSGALPSAAMFETDAWGDAFVADPFGASPVVKVASANLGASSSAGGAGDSGGGMGWGDRDSRDSRDSRDD